MNYNTNDEDSVSAVNFIEATSFADLDNKQKANDANGFKPYSGVATQFGPEGRFFQLWVKFVE